MKLAKPIMATRRLIDTTSLVASLVPTEPAHDHPLEQQAEHRREDAEHDEQRDRGRPPPVEAQLPVGEGGEHPGRAVGEVEDAGRGVGEDEPAGDHRVDRGQAEADDREDQELVHGPGLRPLAYFRSSMRQADVRQRHALAVVTLEREHVLGVAVEDPLVGLEVVGHHEAVRRGLGEDDALRRPTTPSGWSARAARRRSTP